MNDPRGSIWRKWDLHVHTPGTKKNDQYNTEGADIWDVFCKKIEESDVQAFGITDYFSVDNYFSFIQRFKAKYPDSKKVFFPNVELCTNDVVNAGNEEVNLHLIFNPSAPGIDSKIKEFLGYLKTNKSVLGGRIIKASELSSKTDYDEATTTRDFIENALTDAFGNKVDRTEFLLVFTAVNHDGIRVDTEAVAGKKRGTKRKALISGELDKFSNGFFGNSANTQYFINRDRLKTGEDLKPKPVVSGSDAHSFSHLDEWLGKVVIKDGVQIKQSSWIKADLTFEGLRQTIFEPESRVSIGEEPEIEGRVRSNPRKYIESLHIDCKDDYNGRCGSWFANEKIQLNKELVAIIGNKGNGKSALADIIGLLGNSHTQKYEGQNNRTDELFSFLHKDKFRKDHCAANFVGELNWYSGEPDVRPLDADTDTSITENVEYLPQKYLERICSNIEENEFRQKLNEVIFGYVEERDRFGKVSLDGLLDYLSNHTNQEIASAKNALHVENEKVVTIEKKLSLDYRKEIVDKIRIRSQESEAHDKIRPTPVSKPKEDDETAAKRNRITLIEAEINSVKTTIVTLRAEQAAVSKDVEELRQLKQAINRQISDLSGLKPRYEHLLKAAGLRFEDVVTFSANYERVDSVIEGKALRLSEIECQLRTEGTVAILDPETVEDAKQQSLIYRRANLEAQRETIVDQLDKPSREYQEYLRGEEEWQKRKMEIDGVEGNSDLETLNGLKGEFQKISSTYHEDLRLARLVREKASRAVFEKKKTLVSFYDSVKQSIDNEIERNGADLRDYEISIGARLRFDAAFHDEFFKHVNQGVRGSFYGAEDGRSALKDITDSVSDWQNTEKVFVAIQGILSRLDRNGRDESGKEGTEQDIFRQMKQGRDPVDFYDYLFGFDYLETKYDLRVDGKDLNELSPGERGGLLLIFYLMLDRRDIPLVIDQPEDNLDNKSVYEMLVVFLKKAKKRRQIIIVTHNPNLAVVADAEQIIHVTIDKTNGNDFDSYSGAIEDPKINRSVVDILEGTLPAFDNRRLKYRR